MGIVTYIFMVVAFIGAISCAPVDDSTAKPPGASLSTTTTATPEHHSDSTKRQISLSNEDSSSGSDESKESAESSEEKKRPARNTENSGESTHQTKDFPQGTVLTAPPVTKEASRPQLPAREIRETYEHVAVPAVIPIEQNWKTSSTPASTTSARS